MSLTAVLLVLAAAIAHAAWNTIAHGSSKSGMPFLWLGAAVSTALWLPAIAVTGGIGTDDIAGFGLGVGVSALLHVGYMLVLQKGYAAGNLSTVYATARGSGPLLTVIVAVTVLGERPSPLAIIGVLAVVGGVVAIGVVDRKPAVAGKRGWDPGIVYGLLTGVAIAAYTVWDSQSLRVWDLSPVAFMVGCTAIEALIFSGLMGKRWRDVPQLARSEWPRLLAFGVLSPLSYILVLTATTIAPVALVAPMREISVVLVSVFAAFVLRESKPARRIIAASIVAIGIVLLAF